MPPPDPPHRPAHDTITISCLHCGKTQEVARKAQTVTCKHCYKRLELQDQNIGNYKASRAIETIGIVTVDRKGHVIADRIHCGGLIVRGKVKAEVTSRGPVLVGPEADLIGDVTAPTMAVGAGAVLEGHYQVGRMRATPPPEPPELPPAHPVVGIPALPPEPADEPIRSVEKIDSTHSVQSAEAGGPVDPEA